MYCPVNRKNGLLLDEIEPQRNTTEGTGVHCAPYIHLQIEFTKYKP